MFTIIIKADFETLGKISEKLDELKSFQHKEFMINKLYLQRFTRNEFVESLGVPVCHSCNHAKGTKNIDYSPHDKKYKTNDLVNFDFYLRSMNFLYNSKDIGVEIEESKQFVRNIKVLKLSEVYQIHSDIVQDCIKR